MVDRVTPPGDPFEKTIVQLRQVTDRVPEPEPESRPNDAVGVGNDQSIDFDLNLPPHPAQIDLELVDIEKDPAAIVFDRRQGKVVEEQHRYEIEIEERRFRNWMMKALVLCFCTVVILLVGGMIYSTYVKGNTTSESTLKAFIEAVTEILKVLKPGTAEE